MLTVLAVLTVLTVLAVLNVLTVGCVEVPGFSVKQERIQALAKIDGNINEYFILTHILFRQIKLNGPNY